MESSLRLADSKKLENFKIFGGVSNLVFIVLWPIPLIYLFLPSDKLFKYLKLSVKFATMSKVLSIQ
jgi:hypothetical protein